MKTTETNEPLDIEALKALEEKATPVEAWKFRCIYRTDGDRYYARSPLSSCRDDAFADADFINAFRRAGPKLIAEVERLEYENRELGRMKEEVQDLRNSTNEAWEKHDAAENEMAYARITRDRAEEERDQLRQRVKELEAQLDMERGNHEKVVKSRDHWKVKADVLAEWLDNVETAYPREYQACQPGGVYVADKSAILGDRSNDD